MLPPPITLLTDFGTDDGYAAQMKGVILGIAPGAVIIDVTHAVELGDVRHGAIALDQIVDAFPPATIHVVVVDPGVGSDRALVAVEAGGQRFLAPDNGLLSDVLVRLQAQRIHRLTESRFWRSPVTATFHGRDILAPVAAHWSLGIDAAEFGPPMEPQSLVRLAAVEPMCQGATIRGEVIAVDRFGNLITNVSEDLLTRLGEGVELVIGRDRIEGLSRCYSDHPGGSLLMLVGSSRRLEISVAGGSAASRLGSGVGAHFALTGAEARSGQAS